MGRVVSTEIVGVVLAGGRSTRMGGREKALLALAGAPMPSHILKQFAPQVARVAINANGDPARFAAFGLPVIADHMPDHPGPLAGILAALRWASSEGASRVATVSSDAPFIPADLVSRLAEASAATGGGIAVARCEGQVHPLAALWPVYISGELERALATGERRVQRWVEMQEPRIVDFSPVRIGARAIDPFLNVNTPADLAEAETLMQLMSSREAAT
jgi:molybdopterin-guanine dinucleotide biosynthesis protein A